MIPCPLQNYAVFNTVDWVQRRRYVTQEFGKNPQIYSQFGMKGHNGIDYRAKVGTDVFSPIEGKVRVKKSKGGYGWHVKIRNKLEKEVVLAHLSKFFVKDGEYVYAQQKIGQTGNTGFSTGPHLHFGIRRLIAGKGDIFKWQVKDYDNGYYGYYDPLPHTSTWKGTYLKHTI